jgi:hypothetical protein
MKIQRIWAMPSKDTFTIEPIKHLLEEVMDGGYWIDPFAGFNSPATLTNDLNPDAPTDHHLLATDFLDQYGVECDGFLFDPPYSPRQISKTYKSVGLLVGVEETQNGRLYKSVKDRGARLLRPGGIAICCGWNSAGFGTSRKFELLELLVVPHGGAHNDTLVTVERKVAGQHDMFDENLINDALEDG